MERRHLPAFAILSLVCAALMPLSMAAAAEKTRRYELERADKGYRLALRSTDVPAPKSNEVVVRIRAVSLNHRDLYVLQGVYGGDMSGRVPVSDGAGEVVALGPGVQRFKVGDRVATTFFERWNSGPPTPPAISRSRGGRAIRNDRDARGWTRADPGSPVIRGSRDVAVCRRDGMERAVQARTSPARSVRPARRNRRRLDLRSAVRGGSGRQTDHHELERSQT
jgi:hypothetical protein